MKEQAVNTSFTRSNIHIQPAIGLPFYAHGTGFNRTRKGQINLKTDIIKPFVEVIWGIRGVGEVVLYEQKFRIQENDIFFWLPGESHFRYAITEHWDNQWLCFDGPLAEAFMLSFKYPRVHHATAPFPREEFTKLQEIISDEDPCLIRCSAAQIMKILALATDSSVGVGSEKMVKQAVKIISSHLADPELNIEMLCEILHTSKSHFTRRFHELTGKTPGRYILDCRLELAMALLRGTDAQIKEVARRCGFPQPRTFTRFIQRAVQKTPLEVRKSPTRQV